MHVKIRTRFYPAKPSDKYKTVVWGHARTRGKLAVVTTEKYVTHNGKTVATSIAHVDCLTKDESDQPLWRLAMPLSKCFVAKTVMGKFAKPRS